MTPPRAARKPAEDAATEPLTVAQGLQALFDARGWQPFAFQREVWTAIARGQSGLLHATTGTGKTYAAWLGALMAFGTPRAAPSPLYALDAAPPATTR